MRVVIVVIIACILTGAAAASLLASATHYHREVAPKLESVDQLKREWTGTHVPVEIAVQTIAVGDGNRIAILGRQTLRVSSDGGDTWKVISGGNGGRLATIDGGTTYKSPETSSRFIDVRDLCGADAAVITASDRVYFKAMCEHTTQLWSVPLQGDNEPWNIVDFVYDSDPSKSLAVYGPGHNLVRAGTRILVDADLPTGPALLTTDDDGKHWHAVWQGARRDADLIALSFTDDHTGWMLMGDSTLRKTVDGGSSWKDIARLSTFSDKRGLAMSFADSQAGFIVGAGGLILSTTDGGATWRQQESPTTARLYNVVTADGARAWAVGEKGTILETLDGGSRWQTVDLGIDKDIYSGLAAKNGRALILGKGQLFTSPMGVR